MDQVIKGICFALLFLAAREGMTQDLPSFRHWLNNDSLIVARGLGENLYAVDIATGEDTIHYEPVLAWKRLPVPFPEAKPLAVDTARRRVVVRLGGDLFLYGAGMDLPDKLTEDPYEELHPTFSPDGQRLAYTREGNLFVLELDTGRETALTEDGSAVVTNGYATWAYAREILGYRSDNKAFSWSPDGQAIAFLRFDEREVPQFPLFHHEAADSIHGLLQMTRYPKAGDPLPRVSLHLVQMQAGPPKTLVSEPDFPYLAKMTWSASGSSLFYQQMNREQNVLRLYRYDRGPSTSELLIEESRPSWVVFRRLHLLPDRRQFVWSSDRGGWQNLYLYAFSGEQLAQLTDVDWNVHEVAAIQADSSWLYFTGSGQTSTSRHLFRVQLNGDSLRQLTRQEGYHQVHFSPDKRYFVDAFSAHDHPGSLSLWRASGEKVRDLGNAGYDPNRESGIFVEHFNIPTSDGYELPAFWVLPPGFDPTQPHPLVFSIYGGPGFEAVRNRFQDFSKDPLVTNGVIRFVIDHRGSGKLGRAGLNQLHRNLGRWEIRDYSDAAQWLQQFPFIDPDRIGIRGASYGGYLAALAMMKAPEFFSHAVAHAPVTDWRLYNAIYAERYMDRPRDNGPGYDEASVLRHAAQLDGPLLLMHGGVDDNVHVQHTMQLASRLQRQGKSFDLMIYPGGRHGWNGTQRKHARQLEQDFFLNHFYGNQGGAQ